MNIFVEQSELQKAIRLESLRKELLGLGYEVVPTAWLAKLDAAILKRKMEGTI